MAHNNGTHGSPKSWLSKLTWASIVSAIMIVALCLCLYWRQAENKREAEYRRGWDYAGASQALKMYPNAPSAHAAMASVWMKQGVYNKAVHEYRMAVSLEPANPYNHLDLGNALLRVGQLTQARKEWASVARLDVPSGDAATEAARNLRSTDGKHS